ncbi:MAG: hypothetical protein QM739_13665 [Propionivibrio sp.]
MLSAAAFGVGIKQVGADTECEIFISTEGKVHGFGGNFRGDRQFSLEPGHDLRLPVGQDVFLPRMKFPQVRLIKDMVGQLFRGQSSASDVGSHLVQQQRRPAG